MCKKIVFLLIIVFSSKTFYAQDTSSKVKLGFDYGFGNELKNSDYTYTNSYYKLQLYYTIKQTKNFEYEILVQPELNFAKHQLLNFYFVQPDDPNYIEKRERYTKLKDIKEYVLNIGFLMRKPISKTASIYVLGSVGPLFTDTETERLSKGFAFSDVLAIGFTFKINKIIFDIRPNFRHVSNAGLKASNSGYNTKNIDFGFSFSI
ncbi:acyloxyacyl hydrolase [Flavobacterium sp. XS1P27]|uniref:acyloxyacyl hydrolase n=1 Tax=Flavobacterium sp. XS1P27 TaxID=3401724 RepID=UPI003AACC659